jgi:hypothetical protein
MKIKDFWSSRINWKKIGTELGKYLSLKKVFTLERLKEALDKPPYYCHPLVRWFLYQNPTPIKILDDIIGKSNSIFGIREKLDILENPKNESWRFWSTRSELSLALYLKDKVQKIKFLEEGKDKEPDIQVVFKDKTLFFEVYTHRKFYYLLFEFKEILEEILEEILSYTDLQVFFLRDKYVIRKNIEEKDFEKIAECCLENLENLDFKYQLEKNYQTILFEDKSLNICMYIENQRNRDKNNYLLLNRGYGHGDENLYYNAMLREIIEAKRVQLENKHPNILAVNTLFNEDLQTINWKLLNLSYVYFNSIDSFLFFTNDIDTDIITIKEKIINPNSPNVSELNNLINELLHLLKTII